MDEQRNIGFIRVYSAAKTKRPSVPPFTLVSQIHVDFEVAVEKFKGVPYDILDVAAKQVCVSNGCECKTVAVNVVAALDA